MARAGLAIADTIAAQFPASTYRQLLFFIGPGHNGGDGLIAAQQLSTQSYQITLCCPPPSAKQEKGWGVGYAAYQALAAEKEGVTITHTLPTSTALAQHHLIVDAIFGIGLKRSLLLPQGGDYGEGEGGGGGEGEPSKKAKAAISAAGIPSSPPYADWINVINAAHLPVVAIDIPSGLDADTGNIHGVAVRATHTCTLIAYKPGLWTANGPDYTGSISLHSLDLAWQATPDEGQLLTWPTPYSTKERLRNSHKGSYGTVLVLGGAPGMVGAPLLTGKAALFLGAGKVQIGFLASNAPSVDCTCPELMLAQAADLSLADTLSAVTVLAIGPGLGQGSDAKNLLLTVLAALPKLGQKLKPKPAPQLVLDADALNMLAIDADVQLAYQQRQVACLDDQPRMITVLTPHPTEAARLLVTDTAAIQRDRVTAAQTLAQRFSAYVVLKGVGTVIATPEGSWAINSTGNPGLATAGSGDVLTGLISGLLAQNYAPVAALSIAVALHGQAADELLNQPHPIGPAGMTASELIPAARSLMAALN